VRKVVYRNQCGEWHKYNRGSGEWQGRMRRKKRPAKLKNIKKISGGIGSGPGGNFYLNPGQQGKQSRRTEKREGRTPQRGGTSADFEGEYYIIPSGKSGGGNVGNS